MSACRACSAFHFPVSGAANLFFPVRLRRWRIGCASFPKINRGRVDAVTQTRRRRAVVKNMTEMAAAVRAQNFRALHAKAVALALNDRAFCREIGKARPA